MTRRSGVMGIDLGSTWTKVLLFDGQREILSIQGRTPPIADSSQIVQVSDAATNYGLRLAARHGIAPKAIAFSTTWPTLEFSWDERGARRAVQFSFDDPRGSVDEGVAYQGGMLVTSVRSRLAWLRAQGVTGPVHCATAGAAITRSLCGIESNDAWVAQACGMTSLLPASGLAHGRIVPPDQAVGTLRGTASPFRDPAVVACGSGDTFLAAAMAAAAGRTGVHWELGTTAVAVAIPDTQRPSLSTDCPSVLATLPMWGRALQDLMGPGGQDPAQMSHHLDVPFTPAADIDPVAQLVVEDGILRLDRVGVVFPPRMMALPIQMRLSTALDWLVRTCRDVAGSKPITFGGRLAGTRMFREAITRHSQGAWYVMPYAAVRGAAFVAARSYGSSELAEALVRSGHNELANTHA